MINGKIGIVIVNYNGEKYQNDALKTIYQSSYKNFEIIIVDNASTDASVALAKREYPDVHFLLQSENVGIANGNNIGIRYAIKELQVEYILLLNNDIILEKNTLKNLMEKASNNTITVPKIYYYEPPDILWFCGGKMDWKIAESKHIGISETDIGQYDKEHIIEYAPTCCMLIHKDILQDIGDMDNAMFMYFDDTDFCIRANDKGYNILYVPSAFMWHKVSSTSGGNNSKIYIYYITRNKFYFMDKYKDRLQFPAKLYTYIKFLVKFILSPIHRKNDKYILKAWLDYKNGKMWRCDHL